MSEELTEIVDSRFLPFDLSPRLGDPRLSLVNNNYATLCDAPIFGGHFFFFFFSFKSSMYFSFTYPKYMKLYCSNIFLQKAAQGHNPTLFLLTASREHRLLMYLKGGSHDGVSKAQ